MVLFFMRFPSVLLPCRANSCGLLLFFAAIRIPGSGATERGCVERLIGCLSKLCSTRGKSSANRREEFCERFQWVTAGAAGGGVDLRGWYGPVTFLTF
jgi:hypothetical protein